MKHLTISYLLFLAIVNFSFAATNAPESSLHDERSNSPSHADYQGTPQVRGSVSIFELSSDPKTYEGKEIEISGVLIQTSPSYFPTPMFAITNGSDKVRVSAWLPLEVAPSPKGLKIERKKVMSDFLDKYVIIFGKVVLEDGKPMIEVKDARAVD